MKRSPSVQNVAATVRPRRALPQESGVALALIVLVVVLSLLSPYFFNSGNILNVLRGMSIVVILALGQTLVIITGGIDLSVGSVLALSSISAAALMSNLGVNPALAALLGIGVGALCGAVNGLLITRARIAPFIVTLGMLSVARGLTYLISNGSNIPLKPGVAYLGNGYLGPIPLPVIEMFALLALMAFLTNRTVFGRQVYATGSNERAARLSGVNIDRVRLLVYVLMGALAGVAGLINAGTLATAAVSDGQGIELDVIAAVVIGGASLAGGQGSVLGALLGAAILAVLRNGFVLLNFPLQLQTVTIGVVIVLAVGIDQLRQRGRPR